MTRSCPECGYDGPQAPRDGGVHGRAECGWCGAEFEMLNPDDEDA